MAEGGSDDQKLKQAIATVEAQNYKILTTEEYEKLLSHTSKDTLGKPSPSTSTPQVPKEPDATQPKFTIPGLTPLPRLRLGGISNLHNISQVPNTSFVASQYNLPKLPFFSGSEEPQKGETTYEVWSFEVKCLQKSPYIQEDVLLQSIRNSLKGSARSMLVPLGENAKVDDILNKLDGFYGNVSSTETLIQSFYSDYQKPNESIVEYGSRLEQTISRAIRYGHIELVAKDGMLRSKFWTGLRDIQLKHSTRHLYDSIKDFQLLLKEVRKVEQEEISIARPTPKPKVAQQQAGQASGGSEDTNAKLLSQMTELMGRMKAMEKKLEEQQQAIANSNNQASSRLNSFKSQQQFQSGRGRGYGRGYTRGYGRGYNRGSYGRGYQNQNQEQSQGSNGGRDYSRGGQQGGTNGRGANRGGKGTGGNQHLNW